MNVRTGTEPKAMEERSHTLTRPGDGSIDGEKAGPPPMPQVKLTPEEMRVLKECSSESFWYRCLPFSAVFMTSTQVLMNRGLLSPGGGPGKLFVAAIVGYVTGKISYQSACKSKILKLENSRLADMIRKGGRSPYQIFSERPATEPNYEEPASIKSASKDIDSPYDPNKYQGLDESLRPNLDSVPEGSKPWQEEEKVPQTSVSYDDLRRQNRQHYEDRQATYSRQSRPSSLAIPPPPQRAPPPSASSKGNKKNEYGDVWDD